MRLATGRLETGGLGLDIEGILFCLQVFDAGGAVDTFSLRLRLRDLDKLPLYWVKDRLKLRRQGSLDVIVDTAFPRFGSGFLSSISSFPAARLRL